MSEATVAQGQPEQGHPLLRRFVLGLVLVASGVALYVAFALHEDSADLPLRPAAIRFVSPEPGALELRQTTIFYELDPRYAGTLRVDSVVIPDDQLDVIVGLNRYSFTPGEGREISELPPGRTCAVVTYELVTDVNAEPGRYRWCFNVS